MEKKENICILIPAYNEEENIESLVKEWHPIVEEIGNHSTLLIIDDGSKDHTYQILTKLTKKYPCLEVITKENEGHGPTLQYGYQKALEKKTDYIFQTDSDRQTLPSEFWKFWEKRKEYSALIGKRSKRKDGISRIFVTQVLRLVLKMIFRVDVEDANTPFRLMKRELLEKYLDKVPSKFNLTNVLLSLYFVFYKEQVLFIPITFEKRKKGKNSIDIKKISKIGLQAIDDFKDIRDEMIKENKKKQKIVLVIFCFLLALLGISFCSKASILFPIHDGNDANAYLTVGKSWVHGMLPYRDVFDQKGPLLYLIYAFSSLISRTSFLGVYFFEILFFTVFLYYISKTILLFLRREYVYILLPVLASFVVSQSFFTHGGSAEEFTLPFLSYSLYHLFAYIKGKEEKDFSFLFKNGFAAGCILMIKYNLLGFHFAFMIAILLDILNKKEKTFFKTCCSFLIGMCLPFLIFFGYFWLQHAGKEFIDTYFLFNLFGYDIGIPFTFKYQMVIKALHSIFSSHLFYFFFLVFGFIYFIFHKSALPKLHKFAPTFLFVMLLIFVYIGGRTYIYYYLVATPFYLFGLIAAILFLEEYYRKIPYLLFLPLGILSFLYFEYRLWENPNWEYHLYRREDFVQQIFTKEMNKEKDRSFLEYEGLDNGFYLALNSYPTERYFIKLNVNDRVFKDLKEAQEESLREKKTMFVIWKVPEIYLADGVVPELLEENYELIREQNQWYENQNYQYYLYKRK